MSTTNETCKQLTSPKSYAGGSAVLIFLLFNYLSAASGGSAINPAQLLALTVSSNATKTPQNYNETFIILRTCIITFLV